ncbi:MAG: glycosyltransferase family 4 protein [Candidatus Saganbacteria bacterium]|nr:glycosyltransferase family 4 protein [Candidatus Saganbacteria bacterium]
MKILILARMTTSFSGNTVFERPVGGSESALFYLTRELARLGHEIIIFNNCGKEAGIYEGVDYRQFNSLSEIVKISRQKDFDIFISFRDLPAFIFPVKAKKRIWWGHDDFSNVWNYKGFKKYLGAGFLKLAGALVNRYCDCLFVVSGWLGKICGEKLGIRKEKIFVTKNGAYLPYFDGNDTRKNPYRLVYTSVPARGLDVLLDIFPLIRREVPQAALHIYCGFDLGVLKEKDRIVAETIYEKTKQDRVYLEGTRKHSDLAGELQKSGLFLYPSHAVPHAAFYAETSCIAALEAQAAGCPVITSNRGAMPESIRNGETGILIDGDPFSKEYKERFAADTIALLKDPGRYNKMSCAAVRFIRENYSWSLIAKEWTAKFKEMLK